MPAPALDLNKQIWRRSILDTLKIGFGQSRNFMRFCQCCLLPPRKSHLRYPQRAYFAHFTLYSTTPEQSALRLTE